MIIGDGTEPLVGRVISNLQSLVVPREGAKVLVAIEGFVYQEVDIIQQCIQIMYDGQMMRHIRIFLIFVANTDRNENNHCRIRVSF